MRKLLFTAAITAVFFIAALNALAGNVVTPSTTLSIETGNNTSTADSFRGWSNGNQAATNVSKVDTHTLLYPGSNTKILAHFLPWFGRGGHLDIGYNSAEAAQVTRQVEDMLSRGIQGAIIDWYGQNGSHEDITTEHMMAAAESHKGFVFAIMEDAGAVRGCGSCQGALISDLIYAYHKYEQSPAYFRIDGRPVVFFFDADQLSGVNMKALQAAVPGNPIFVIKNIRGFQTKGVDGAYSWVTDKYDNNNWGQGYLERFYKLSQQNGEKHSFGSTKKGFNDSKATWGAHKFIPQNCGQTWLNTFAEIGKYYSASKQLENLQIVTWNDYEEGTALETGIDNCLAISGTASADVVSWRIKGSEKTVDHYTAFISSDGENLMPVADVPAGTEQLNLGQYGFPQGAYTVYVKAVGRPSIRNHMTEAISYHSSGAGGGGGIVADSPTITTTPTSVSLKAGQSATITVTVSPSATFRGTITFGCAGLPAGVNCSFANDTLPVSSQPASTTLTVSVAAATTASLTPRSGMFALWLPGLGLGMVVAGNQARSKKSWVVLGLLILIAVLITAGCGGISGVAGSKATANGTGTPSAPLGTVQPGTYPITIQGTTGTTQKATVVSLVVN